MPSLKLTGSWRNKLELPFPFIFMKCLRHLVALLRSRDLSCLSLLLLLGMATKTSVPRPAPQLSARDLHFIFLFALFQFRVGHPRVPHLYS